MLRGEEVLAFTGTPGGNPTAAADNRGLEEQQLGGS
jgi:hypothetical protein